MHLVEKAASCQISRNPTIRTATRISIQPKDFLGICKGEGFDRYDSFKVSDFLKKLIPYIKLSFKKIIPFTQLTRMSTMLKPEPINE